MRIIGFRGELLRRFEEWFTLHEGDVFGWDHDTLHGALRRICDMYRLAICAEVAIESETHVNC
jgi:hypothetical protein